MFPDRFLKMAGRTLLALLQTLTQVLINLVLQEMLTKRKSSVWVLPNISIQYKYADSYSITNYAVFQYGENGKVSELDNFRIGRDSYVVRDGQIKMKDILSGNIYWANMDGNDSRNTSHNIDIF